MNKEYPTLLKLLIDLVVHKPHLTLFPTNEEDEYEEILSEEWYSEKYSIVVAYYYEKEMLCYGILHGEESFSGVISLENYREISDMINLIVA